MGNLRGDSRRDSQHHPVPEYDPRPGTEGMSCTAMGWISRLKKPSQDCRREDHPHGTAGRKEFIRLRDTSPAFGTIKADGSIGIPCFVSEDGRISFDTEAFIPEELPAGPACSLDGKGC